MLHLPPQPTSTIEDGANPALPSYEAEFTFAYRDPCRAMTISEKPTTPPLRRRLDAGPLTKEVIAVAFSPFWETPILEIVSDPAYCIDPV